MNPNGTSMHNPPNPTPIESGDPLDDPKAFRRSLGQFATGVTVLTARHGDLMAGMTVNSFSALSLDPPLVLWSIRKQSASLTTFREASHFAVNVLSAAQTQTSALFGSTDADKFAQVDWQPGRGGAPLLGHCIAHFECRLEQLVDGGDHLILVGRVERHARYAGEPLLFTQGRYGVPQDIQDAVPTAGPDTSPPATGTAIDVDKASWLRLLHYSSHELSACFEGHRNEEGLSVAAFRLYSWLRSSPHTLDELKRLTYLGERNAQDSLQELALKGHVHWDNAQRYSLTDLGRERADAIARRVAAFEVSITQGLSAAEIATARKVLGRLAQCAHHP